MDTIIIAKVLGVYLMVSGVFVVTQKRTLAKYLQDLFAHRAITMLVGVLLLLAGVTLVMTLGKGTPLVITILAWAILAKGVAYIFTPEWLYAIVRSWSTKSFSMLGVLTAAFGVYLYFFLMP